MNVGAKCVARAMNLGGTARTALVPLFVDGIFLFCIHVVARSALVLRDEAISYTVGDCFVALKRHSQ